MISSGGRAPVAPGQERRSTEPARRRRVASDEGEAESLMSIGDGAAATVDVRSMLAMRGSLATLGRRGDDPFKKTTTAASSVDSMYRSIESPARRAPAARASDAPTGTATSRASRIDDVHRRRRSARAHSHAAPPTFTPTAAPSAGERWTARQRGHAEIAAAASSAGQRHLRRAAAGSGARRSRRGHRRWPATWPDRRWRRAANRRASPRRP